jgi:hypothetical protein
MSVSWGYSNQICRAVRAGRIGYSPSPIRDWIYSVAHKEPLPHEARTNTNGKARNASQPPQPHPYKIPCAQPLRRTTTSRARMCCPQRNDSRSRATALLVSIRSKKLPHTRVQPTLFPHSQTTEYAPSLLVRHWTTINSRSSERRRRRRRTQRARCRCCPSSDVAESQVCVDTRVHTEIYIYAPIERRCPQSPMQRNEQNLNSMVYEYSEATYR